MLKDHMAKMNTNLKTNYTKNHHSGGSSSLKQKENGESPTLLKEEKINKPQFLTL